MVRVSYPYDRLKGFTHRLAEVCSRLAVYEHQASRIHIHAFVQDCTVTVQTLKNWVTEELGEKPTRDQWSFKNKTREGPAEPRFITYMSKGKLDPAFVKGFTDEEITTYRSQWVELTTGSGTPAESAKEKITIFQMARELAQYIDAKSQVAFDTSTFTFNTEEERGLMRNVVIQAIRIHNKYEKSYTEFCIQRCVQTALGLCSKQHLKEELIAKCLKRLSS